MAKEKMKVLVVDDERDFADGLSERLQLRELDADVAYGGEEALKALSEGGHDVMVLDLRMPGIDGMEVLRRVRETSPQTRVVILTGHGSEKDMEEARRLGAFEYMEKPVQIDRLNSTLHSAWESVKRIKKHVENVWMAAAFSQAGANDFAAEMLEELDESKKQPRPGAEKNGSKDES